MIETILYLAITQFVISFLNALILRFDYKNFPEEVKEGFEQHWSLTYFLSVHMPGLNIMFLVAWSWDRLVYLFTKDKTEHP
jgi:hypothetical protein